MTQAGKRSRLRVAPGDVVFQQGTRGRLVYVVESGEVELVRTRADGRDERLGIARRGDYFGELSPLLGFRRAATARVRKAGVLVAYDVQEFRLLLGTDGISKVLGKRAAVAQPL